MCAYGRVAWCGCGISRCEGVMVAICPVSGRTVRLLFVGPVWDCTGWRTRLWKAGLCDIMLDGWQSPKDLRRRVCMLIFWIKNEMSHLFSTRPVCITQSLSRATPPHCCSSTFSFRGVFISCTVIFFIFTFSTGHTKIVVVNKRVAYSARENWGPDQLLN